VAHHRGLVITVVVAVIVGAVAILALELTTNDTDESAQDSVSEPFFGGARTISATGGVGDSGQVRVDIVYLLAQVTDPSVHSCVDVRVVKDSLPTRSYITYTSKPGCETEDMVIEADLLGARDGPAKPVVRVAHLVLRGSTLGFPDGFRSSCQAESGSRCSFLALTRVLAEQA
jgi:hypothetical protein